MNVAQLDRPSFHRPTGKFVRHFLEMTLAMMVGMVVLGLPVRILAPDLAYPNGLSGPFPELSLSLMTVEMVLPMALWMRFRGHRRQLITEMSAAVLLPTLLLVPLCLAHLIQVPVLRNLSGVGMFVAMLAAMLYRRAEYTMEHCLMVHAGPSEA
jgi:hypothetical protein